MIRRRKLIAGLFAIVLAMSAWTGAGATCETDAALTAAPADAHAHHAMNAPSQDHQGMDHSNHLAGSGDEAEHGSSAECPCCGSCASMCVMSGASPVALPATNEPFSPGAGALHLPKVDAFQPGPAPHAPYRPPILSA